MALTAGLLTFLAVDALAEALELQAALPGRAAAAPASCSSGSSLSYLALTWISTRFSRVERRAGGDPALSGLALATLVAIGIGLHNLGEGLAIGSSFAFGELALGTFLIVGFMIHNVTEGLGIAAPIAEGGAGQPRAAGGAGPDRRGARRSSAPGSAASSRTTSSACCSSRSPSGAALQVVVEVGRFVARRAPGRAHLRLRDRRLPGRHRDHVRHRPDRRLGRTQGALRPDRQVLAM